MPLSKSNRYLSKSRFKLALECMTKMYHTGKKKEYADQNNDDPFLKALAEGGFQVDELASYLFSNLYPKTTHFTEASDAQQKAIANARLRYCVWDTIAMVLEACRETRNN